MLTHMILKVGMLLAVGATAVAEIQDVDKRTDPPTAVQEQQKFWVMGMSCGQCARHAVEQLQQIEGIREAEVDYDLGTASLTSERAINADEIRRALNQLGLEARFAGEPELLPLSEQQRASLDIRLASRGESIRIRDHLAPGKITIFDYFAEWCGPCHLLSPKLERLLLKYPDLALRTVDIVNWESAVAQQATQEFQIPGLPYVRIYTADGKLIGTVEGNQIERVDQIIRKYQER